MVLLFGFYLKDSITDIQQSKDGWKESHKLAPGDDLIEDEDKADEKKKRAQERSTPIGEESGFHSEGLRIEGVTYFLGRFGFRRSF